jgi:hypothetical protein
MYDKIKTRYDRGWVTLQQLHRYVELGVLTPAEYQEICGQEYIA